MEASGSFESWLAAGVDHGWVSEPVCATHDGVPSTPEGLADWEDGGDPCETVVRVWWPDPAPRSD